MTHSHASLFFLPRHIKIQNNHRCRPRMQCECSCRQRESGGQDCRLRNSLCTFRIQQMLFEMSGWWGLPSYGSAESGAPHRCLSCLPMFLLQPHFCSRMAFFCAWKRARRGGRLGCYVLCYVGEVMGFNGLSYHVLYV